MRAEAHPPRDGTKPAHTTMTISSLEVRILKKLAKIRLTACRNQGSKCFYCHQPMWDRDVGAFAKKHSLSIKQARRFMVTAEHLCARSAGGSDVAGNIVAACLFCNIHRHRAKHPLCPASFSRRVRKRLEQGKWHGFFANRGIPERPRRVGHPRSKRMS